jgi:hypothetical protein
MLFEVRRQRIRGVPVPKEQRHRIVPVRGDLRVQEATVEAMGRRVCRVASLHALSRAINDQLLPPLHDVAILWMAPLGMVLGGIEFEGGVSYFQTWHVTPWERFTPSLDRPRQLASHEGAAHREEGRSATAPRSSDPPQVTPVAEPTCKQEDSTAVPASPSKAAVGESNPF